MFLLAMRSLGTLFIFVAGGASNRVPWFRFRIPSSPCVRYPATRNVSSGGCNVRSFAIREFEA